MTPQEITAALNQNTEATNALLKLYQRDPMREFALGHSLKKNPTTYADSLDAFSQGDCYNPRTIASKKNSTDTIITGDFKFPMPPRRIDFSITATGTAASSPTKCVVAIAFSNDGNRFSQPFRVPLTTYQISTAAISHWSQSFLICSPYVRVLIASQTASLAFPAAFFTPSNTNPEWTGTDSGLSIIGYY